MKNIILASTLMLGAVMASTQVQAADNRQNYNGSYCDAYAGSQSGSLVRQPNGIRNISNGAVRVTCPVIVDEVVNVTGTNHVWFHTSSANTSCVLYSMNGNGAVLQTRANAGGPGWVNIANLTADDIWGSYTMICTLPAGATLNTIAISERP